MKEQLIYKFISTLHSFQQKIKTYFQFIIKAAVILAAVSTIIAFFQQIGVWALLLKWFFVVFNFLASFLLSSPWGAPNFIWLLVLILFFSLIISLVGQDIK